MSTSVTVSKRFMGDSIWIKPQGIWQDFRTTQGGGSPGPTPAALHSGSRAEACAARPKPSGPRATPPPPLGAPRGPMWVTACEGARGGPAAATGLGLKPAETRGLLHPFVTGRGQGRGGLAVAPQAPPQPFPSIVRCFTNPGGLFFSFTARAYFFILFLLFFLFLVLHFVLTFHITLH